MGLDNMPKGDLPCVRNRTAKHIDGVLTAPVDCKLTQAEGGCPWLTAEKRPTEGLVLGMFGQECWYRGKYGNYLLEIAGIYDEDDVSFYGDNSDGTVKSADSCLILAQAIEELLEVWDRERAYAKSIAEQHKFEIGKLTEDLKYAAWYARWSAENGGMACWY